MITIKAAPLKLSNATWHDLTVVAVQIVVKISHREFTTNNDKIILPESECWFLVRFEFEFRRTDGQVDEDSIITNGSEYFLVNTSLVSPKRKKVRFVLNEQTKNAIDLAIMNFVNSL